MLLLDKRREVGRESSFRRSWIFAPFQQFSQRDKLPFRLLYILTLVIVVAVPAFSQHERGEIRLSVRDPMGGPLSASVKLVSEASHVRRSFLTDKAGNYIAHELPFGVYQLKVSHEGFDSSEQLVEVRSEIPLRISVTLSLALVRSQINVLGSATLVDPQRTGTVFSVGSQAIREELPTQMGRGLTDLVNSEPGWLYEGNGVLHPRGSEYDVQFVVNGLPITENRSPAFAPAFESENVNSMRIMTAGFPAEYGRKLGGVVEINTQQDIVPGLHLTASADGGSFATAGGYLGMSYGHGTNQINISGNAGLTARYLDPPVTANFTNHSSTGGGTAAYSRDFTDRQRLRLSVTHHEVRYLVPNEMIQEKAGQRQDAADQETGAQMDYELELSPNLLFEAESSVRDESFNLWSNDLSTPVVISQQRGFRQGYGRVALAGHHGRHDWKIGADVIFNPVHEALQYQITNPSLFDPSTALSFNFFDRRTDLEPAAYAQDEFHYKNWNVSLGVRYDDYHFVVSQSAWSPRVALSYYCASPDLLIHMSYDRVFQTPALENLLLASSPQLGQVSNLVLRLPVEPAHANYYEVGITKGFWGKVRLDTNLFRRNFKNFSDDDTLFDTGVSFPISYARAWIQGAEAKLELPRWGRFSAFASYSNQEGVGQGPITGGLFIGSQAIQSVPANTRFWVSQDQRNTARAHVRFQATKRFWVAIGSWYGSGLPVELDTGDTNYAFLLSQYGPSVLSEVNFKRGRVRPSYSIDASAGLDLYDKNDRTVSVELQGSNLTNHLNVINFASLFSGTAIGIPRSFGARLKIRF
ncbi:MAG TPA: TonB-dependent receptor [Terriglobia bacterium]|nr:TonB-dependent receptor [Terriglobia bacterium]